MSQGRLSEQSGRAGAAGRQPIRRAWTRRTPARQQPATATGWQQGALSGGQSEAPVSGARRRRLGLALLGATLLLAGCAPLTLPGPVVLYVAISTMGDEPVTRHSAQLFHSRFRTLVQGFQRIHPDVVVQLSVYREEQLLAQIRHRERSGLGPDLIITTSDQANALLSNRLIQPIPQSPQLRDAIDPTLLRLVTDRRGRISAQPQGIYTQLACYDRRKLPRAPKTVDELLAASAAGARVGLALRLRDLFWSAGSLGALPAIRKADQGGVPDPREMEGLRQWIRWLQNAESQSRLTFVEADTTLRDSFQRGKLDWISCRSSDLSQLQQALGPRLGISALPDGEGFRAAPVNQLRVMALGRGSSRRQRTMALALASYGVSPLVQRNLTLENLSFLPVNRHVSVPERYSHVLTAMQEARSQTAAGSGTVLANLHAADPRIGPLRQVIVPAVFGQMTPAAAADRIVKILRRQR